MNRYTQKKRLEKIRLSQRRKNENREHFTFSEGNALFRKQVKSIWETITERRKDKKRIV